MMGIVLVVAGLGLGVMAMAGNSGKGDSKAAKDEAPTSGKAAGQASSGKTPPSATPPARIQRIERTEAEWKALLTPEQFRILRQKGTEPAFTGAYWKQHDPGTYVCAGCGLELFHSDEKFDSGTGWPSFWAPSAPGHVAEESDRSFGMVRTEVLCARCGGHLGHVFDDGPKPTGLRYCINSAALNFEKPSATTATRK
jgi:peptide-methionine (R)-S-oxide reductase